MQNVCVNHLLSLILQSQIPFGDSFGVDIVEFRDY